ncbi:ExbD/TolR family protein [Alphaproteobacteria bacterium endosymbiont of Tiliacea citrago]|uniref:ExbD/TolR family protein n=1 Tax=Alphaproteobacteria bacterium endosymbiont of Tiliacea citrago TaxID=3077944 RepID=UPI00313F1842
MSKKRAADINITPLVDILLVLLVIFMVTTPMMVREIYVDVPKVVSVVQSKNVIKYDRIITISLNDKQKIFYNGKEISYKELVDTLSKEPKDSVVAVEAGKFLSYQLVYSLLVKLQDAGFQNVSLTGFY